MTDSTFLTEKNGFRYSIATPAWQDRMVRILAESFCREPMAAALGTRPEQMSQVAELFVPECASNGLSVIATPVDAPETLAGVFICRDFKAPAPAEMEKLDWLMPVMHALITVDKEYERGRPGLAPADYRFDGQPLFADIPALHTHLVLFEKEL